ncbi:MAG: hypothetical protein AB7E51_14640 [Pseudodesulfovibrio sp.]|uniref:hypothetical protein n=1 Tax=Pseudodesulfovibrio sp. TaxID=2035812 RepID=UPI003D0BD7F6
MPTNRRRRTREFNGCVPRLAAWQKKGLLTGEDDGTGHGWDRFGFFYGTQGMVPGKCLSMEEAWRHFGSHLLAEWIREHPGTRPYGWWRFEAPEPRRRLGGEGDPAYMGVTFGVPDGWCEGDFDPSDPPVYESQAAYLDRHGLLTEAERRALEKCSGAFEPEVLPNDAC